MPKGQLFRVPWQGNSWMPFTFQTTLRALNPLPDELFSVEVTFSLYMN